MKEATAPSALRVQEALGARGLVVDFWQIAMRPGKPLLHGRLGCKHRRGGQGHCEDCGSHETRTSLNMPDSM